MTGEVAEYCRELFNEIADEFEFQIAEIEIMPDHVHLFVTAHLTGLQDTSLKKLYKKYIENQKSR